MIYLNEPLKEAIREHAREAYPEEACGFVVRSAKDKMRVVRSPNLAADKQRYFRTCPKLWRELEDAGEEILAGYNSHPNGPARASDGDKTAAEKEQIPLIILGWPINEWEVYQPSGWRAKLIGRPFVHGVLDCFSLARDYYEEKLGIEIPDYYREDDWWFKGQDLYMEKFEEAGFVRVDDGPREHDALLIQTPKSPVANHCAIYLGDGLIMHHVQNRVSKVEPYVAQRGDYARGVRAIVRHKSLL